MVIYTLDMLNQSLLTLDSQMNLKEKPICALMIRIHQKRIQEYVDSIKEDVKWLGFDWDNLFFASDYFDEMYDRAVLLIKKGIAYV